VFKNASGVIHLIQIKVFLLTCSIINIINMYSFPMCGARRRYELVNGKRTDDKVNRLFIP